MMAVAMPPYTSIVAYVDNAFAINLNLGNYTQLFADSQYVVAYLSSIKIALVSTLLTLLIGYPMAYVISRMSPSARNIAMLLVVPCVLMTLLWWMFDGLPGEGFSGLGPALLALVPFIIMFLVTSVTTLRERTSGTLERLLAMPMGKLDFLLGYAVARVPLRALARQVVGLAWVAVPLLAFQWVSTSWRTGVGVVGSFVALVLLAGLVTLTTRTTAMVDVVVRGAGWLRRFGVDPQRVGLMLALGIRSVHVVLGLAQEVREAQHARGLRSSPRAFAVPLIVRSLRHADRLGEALSARGVDD